MDFALNDSNFKSRNEKSFLLFVFAYKVSGYPKNWKM